MNGAKPPFSQYASWRGAQLKSTGTTLPFTFTLQISYLKDPRWRIIVYKKGFVFLQHASLFRHIFFSISDQTMCRHCINLNQNIRQIIHLEQNSYKRNIQSRKYTSTSFISSRWTPFRAMSCSGACGNATTYLPTQWNWLWLQKT
jgi:hypothetical protein